VNFITQTPDAIEANTTLSHSHCQIIDQINTATQFHHPDARRHRSQHEIRRPVSITNYAKKEKNRRMRLIRRLSDQYIDCRLPCLHQQPSFAFLHISQFDILVQFNTCKMKVTLFISLVGLLMMAQGNVGIGMPSCSK
jgi:hypothetical protein